MGYPTPAEVRHIRTHARVVVLEALTEPDLDDDERARVVIALLALVDELSPEPAALAEISRSAVASTPQVSGPIAATPAVSPRARDAAKSAARE